MWKRCPHKFTVARLGCSHPVLWLLDNFGQIASLDGKMFVAPGTDVKLKLLQQYMLGFPGSCPAIIYSVNSTCCYSGCLLVG